MSMTPHEIATRLRAMAQIQQHPSQAEALVQAAAYLIELETLVEQLDRLGELSRQIEVLELELKMARS